MPLTVVLTTLILCLTVVEVALLFRPRPQPVVLPEPEPERVPSVLDERLLDYVIVTLKSGTTFGGVLYVEDAGAVVLANAEHLEPGGKRTPADGEIVILRGDVDYIQRP